MSYFLSDSQLVMFGPLHILYLVLMVVISFVLCVFVAKKHNPKYDRIVCGSIGIFLICIEIYKQVFFTVEKGYYEWGYFPWQFCSVPMYVATIAAFIKEGKLQESLYRFLGLFGLSAGIITMILPSAFGEYHDYILIIFHSLTWHALLVVMGSYLIVSKRIYVSIKQDVIPAAKVFLTAFCIAIVLNIVSYYAFFNTSANVHELQFSMFYVHPYYINTLPVLGNIQQFLVDHLPTYIAFICYVIVYLTVFIGSVCIIFKMIQLLSKIKRNA